jgi:probable phosphoglycerate mutase
MTRYFLIRHAETSAVSEGLTGRAAAPLTRLGVEQASRLAHRIGAASMEAIYSSPQERALETARAIAAAAGRDVRVAAELDEIDYGEWTGRSIDSLASSQRWLSFNTMRSITRIPQGESILEVQARIVGFMQVLRERHPEAALALVSHADVIRAALVYYMGVPLDLMLRFEISPASLTIMDVDESTPVIRCLNSTEPVWP